MTETAYIIDITEETKDLWRSSQNGDGKRNLKILSDLEHSTDQLLSDQVGRIFVGVGIRRLVKYGPDGLEPILIHADGNFSDGAEGVLNRDLHLNSHSKTYTEFLEKLGQEVYRWSEEHEAYWRSVGVKFDDKGNLVATGIREEGL